jgi:hypothetical protein
MVGGTFGVAVLGAMVSTLGRSKIDQLLPGAPAASRERLAGSLGSGGVLHGVSVQAVDASQRAFVYALQYGLRLGSVVALLGALLAWTLVSRKAASAASAASAPVAAAAEPAHGPARARAAETVHV